jgi:hypothetical protein
MDDDSLRVATWCGSDGRRGEIAIDADWREEDAKLAEIQERRDRSQNEFAPHMVAWIKDRRESLPEWLRERTEHIDKWRSPGAYHQLSIDWRSRRFHGDDTMFADLDRWRKTDKHLWQHHDRLRDRLISRRVQTYRRFLVDIARRYQHLSVAKVEWARLSKKARTEDDETQTSRQRHNARMASPGLFSQLAKEYFGTRIVVVDSHGVTSICHQCGHDNKTLDRSKRVCRCDDCGRDWDQDVNACANTLARGSVLLESRGPLADLAAQGVSDVLDGVDSLPDGAENGTARKTRRNRKSAAVL